MSSELKGLEGFATAYGQFPPGHYFYSRDKDFTRWYIRDWMQYDNVKDNPASVEELHDALEAAVRRQLMSDVPYGVLLSGGLDSSITSAIAKNTQPNASRPKGRQMHGGRSCTPSLSVSKERLI